MKFPSEEWRGPESKKIQNIFSNVAKRYDLANTILSAGIHHSWRKKAVKLSGAAAGQFVLDCATGTGDLAIEFARVVNNKSESKGNVIGTDFCSPMMETAPRKAFENNVQIEFKNADVQDLPFSDQSFDICSISFGIRNVENPLKAISEMARVVKPRGKVVVLEFGQPKNFLFNKIYNIYAKKFLPNIGGFITGNRAAYGYLQSSSEKFPCSDDFLMLMQEAHPFVSMKCYALSGGIAYIYVAEKPSSNI